MTFLILLAGCPIILLVGFQFLVSNKWSPLEWPRTIRLIAILLIDLADRLGWLPAGSGVTEVGMFPPWVAKWSRRLSGVSLAVVTGLVTIWSVKHYLAEVVHHLQVARQEQPKVEVPSYYPYPRPIPTNIPAGYPYPNPLPTVGATPPSYTDDRPQKWDEFIGGGFRVVQTVDELNAIGSSRRKEGMIVYVSADGRIRKLERDLTTWTDIGPPK